MKLETQKAAADESVDLASTLDVLAQEGRLWIREARARAAFEATIPHALLAALIAPAGILLAGLLEWEGGVAEPGLAIWKGMLFTLVAPALVFAFTMARAGLRSVSRGEALAAYDDELALADRLQTADEFLSIADEKRSSFVHAAIADAHASARRATSTTLAHASIRWSAGPRDVTVLMLALVFLVAPHLLSNPRAESEPEAGGELALVASDRGAREPDERRRATTPPASRGRREERVDREENTRGPESPPAEIARHDSKVSDTNDEVIDSRGKTKGGKPSSARSSGRADQSRGEPGMQAPPSAPTEERELTPKKKKRRKKPESAVKPPSRKKKVEDRSGTTAGRGSSSGSSRNPAVSQWSSKDRVEESEDEDFDEEEDVDDEESESEARGGLQPNLRDRRPPVNRDLAIGFGSRPNPDANGRGGPSQRKKSRGVAALVLGVPIPDQVRGEPNPGRVKITQERVRPQRESSTVAEAESRGEREGPIGSLSRVAMGRWMRALVREYFLRRRSSGEVNS